jgi:hypothetical protein
MKLKVWILTGVAVVIGWNVSLIQRDQAMFDSYNRCLSVQSCSK